MDGRRSQLHNAVIIRMSPWSQNRVDTYSFVCLWIVVVKLRNGFRAREKLTPYPTIWFEIRVSYLWSIHLDELATVVTNWASLEIFATAEAANLMTTGCNDTVNRIFTTNNAGICIVVIHGRSVGHSAG